MAERPLLRLRARAGSVHPEDAASCPKPNPAVDTSDGIIRVAEPLIGPEEADRVAAVLASTLVTYMKPPDGAMAM